MTCLVNSTVYSYYLNKISMIFDLIFRFTRIFLPHTVYSLYTVIDTKRLEVLIYRGKHYE